MILKGALVCTYSEVHDVLLQMKQCLQISINYIYEDAEELFTVSGFVLFSHVLQLK